MKINTLLLLAMFMMVSFVEAKIDDISNENNKIYYRSNQAVSFIERGVQFHVFLNGDFDFNARQTKTRRNQKLRIFRNFRGIITKVGDIYINYNSKGNVRKIGAIKMSYRKNRLIDIGNLSIYYTRWGDAVFYGQVKFNDYYYNRSNYYNSSIGVNLNPNIGTICVYNDPYFYRNEFRNNYRQFREDDHFFYYRSSGNTSTSRNKILKRRKPSRSINQSINTKTNRKREIDIRNSNINHDSKKRTQIVRKIENKRRGI
tara:strand:+ start:34843 stop:35616 length:774 start_codon:yes stop_codon:yes gene_type:complete